MVSITNLPKIIKYVDLTPKYLNPSTSSYFLGNIEELNTGKDYDVYYDLNGPDIIARYGSGPADFVSGFRFAEPDSIVVLWYAKLLAMRLDLPIPEVY